AWAMTGQPRWWHLGHTAMALGMAAMYLLPTMEHPGFGRFGLATFAVVTVAVLGAAVVHWRREGVANPLWLATTLDMLEMTSMFLPMSDWVPVVTGILLGDLVLQCVACAGNLWAHLPLYVRGSPAADTAVAGDAPGAASAHSFNPRTGLT